MLNEALRDFTSAIECNPWYAKAYQVVITKNIELVKKSRLQLIHLRYYYRGALYMAKGQLDMAVTDFEMSIAKHPTLVIAHRYSRSFCYAICIAEINSP